LGHIADSQEKRKSSRGEDPRKKIAGEAKRGKAERPGRVKSQKSEKGKEKKSLCPIKSKGRETCEEARVGAFKTTMRRGGMI